MTNSTQLHQSSKKMLILFFIISVLAHMPKAIINTKQFFAKKEQKMDKTQQLN